MSGKDAMQFCFGGRVLAPQPSHASTAVCPSHREQEEIESQASEEKCATTASWELSGRRRLRRRPEQEAARMGSALK